uniref:Uncharacterized protein n=1 Tax=Romanomermis culicivorax TaxID=13658 RepID=A0A915KJA5_ROMCU
ELILRAAEQRRLAARETSAPTGLTLSPALTPKGSASSFHSDGAADSTKPSTSSSLLGPMTTALSVMSGATPDNFLRWAQLMRKLWHGQKHIDLNYRSEVTVEITGCQTERSN